MLLEFTLISILSCSYFIFDCYWTRFEKFCKILSLVRKIWFLALNRRVNDDSLRESYATKHLSIPFAVFSIMNIYYQCDFSYWLTLNLIWKLLLVYHIQKIIKYINENPQNFVIFESDFSIITFSVSIEIIRVIELKKKRINFLFIAVIYFPLSIYVNILTLYYIRYAILVIYMLDSGQEPSYNLSTNLLLLPRILKLMKDMVDDSTPPERLRYLVNYWFYCPPKDHQLFNAKSFLY